MAKATFAHIVGILLAASVIVPGMVWLASNYLAVSPYLQGFAFRDLSAVGIALFALSRYFRN